MLNERPKKKKKEKKKKATPSLHVSKYAVVLYYYVRR